MCTNGSYDTCRPVRSIDSRAEWAPHELQGRTYLRWTVVTLGDLPDSTSGGSYSQEDRILVCVECLRDGTRTSKPGSGVKRFPDESTRDEVRMPQSPINSPSLGQERF